MGNDTCRIWQCSYTCQALDVAVAAPSSLSRGFPSFKIRKILCP